jgi:hypothetical protein
MLCLDDCFDTTIISQPTEITQFIFGQPLSNKPSAEVKKPNCVNGKPCGNTCIAKDKVCHK